MGTHYQNPNSCNKCGEMSNILTNTVYCDGDSGETETKCSMCGFIDYWAYGFFESGSEIKNKAQTYQNIGGRLILDGKKS